ncbi:helix-turn-helix transcriptional regulator [Lentzea sp. NPDC092896]|uniref:helix-turn-helix transcriptional regulator n=1 Tax=Lentzea sp. NPDC092896 TaxID=3364127 RepID=UPI00381EFBD7
MTERPRFITVECLWTPAVLAEFLGIPEKTLTDWRYRGIGPSFVRLGKHVRYRPDDVRSWLDEQAAA